MSEPLAYFLTWTTYGTWLHGDRRGSVDRTNAWFGTDYHPQSDRWSAASERRMKSPPVVLSPSHRQTVEQALRKHVDLRGWEILALSCRSNHVHAVVAAGDVPPERVMTEMKAYATRALRATGEMTSGKVWTRHGSTRYVRTSASLEAAVRYVQTQ